jgi:hypothetical protein
VLAFAFKGDAVMNRNISFRDGQDGKIDAKNDKIRIGIDAISIRFDMKMKNLEKVLV